jgi:hypothetical protein
MNDKERAEIYVSLYKHQLDHYERTRDVEWKANFGIWTLLAGAIYLAAKETVTISRPLTAVGLTGVIVVHFFWLLAVQRSESSEVRLYSEYRHKALLLVDPEDRRPSDLRRYPWYKTLVWLVLEVGMTTILSVGLFSMLFWRSKP